MSTASPNLQLSTAIITHCSSGCSSTKYFPQCVNTAYFSSSMKTGLEPEPTPLNPHYTTSLTRSKFEPPPELSCSYLQMQEQLSNPAHASAPATHPRAGSAHICLLGAAALSCRQHPGGSGTHARPVAAAAFVSHALSNPIRNTGQEESSSTRRTQKQAAGSRLPASRQHHLGAERDCFIPAHSPTGRLLSFFQENHTSRVHCILSSCRPPPSHRHHLPSPGWRTAPPSCTGVQGTLQHVAVSYCKALLLSTPPPPPDTALQCCISLCTFHFHFQAAQCWAHSFVLRAPHRAARTKKGTLPSPVPSTAALKTSQGSRVAQLSNSPVAAESTNTASANTMLCCFTD